MGFDAVPLKADRKYVDRLVEELGADREAGQPFIYEQGFSTGKVRILVVWDEWKELTLEQRTNVIHSAIEQSDGKEYRTRVALASGLTVPEGVAAGMLPYQILAARRNSDHVTFDQCRQAMLEEGASQLFGPDILQLRFPTEDAAESSRKRLIAELPGSDDIWIVTKELSAQDFAPSWDSIGHG
jgi:hypothetical protein